MREPKSRDLCFHRIGQGGTGDTEGRLFESPVGSGASGHRGKPSRAHVSDVMSVPNTIDLPSGIKVIYPELPNFMEHFHLVALLVVPCAISLWLYRRTNDRLHDKPPPAFEYPVIEPCTEELSLIKPTPYRPFKWGAYQ